MKQPILKQNNDSLPLGICTNVLKTVFQAKIRPFPKLCIIDWASDLDYCGVFVQEGKGYMHARRAANVHLAIRTVSCRGCYCCCINSPRRCRTCSVSHRGVTIWWLINISGGFSAQPFHVK